MTKHSFSTLLALALVAGLFGAVPAHAQAVTIPETVQITDPLNDANFLNDQDNAYGTPLAGQHDHVTPADVGSATDLLKVWFTHTAADITLNIQTQAAPGNLAYDIYMRFSSNAGEGPVAADNTRGCLQWVASINGAAGAYTGVNEGVLTDKCNVGTPVVGPLVIAEGPDGTGVTQITFPRSYSPLLADGQKLTAPFGVVRVAYVGPSPTTATAATIDSTKRGTDYEITGGGPAVASEPEPAEEPPAKSDPPDKGKKKGCKKGKGKKKGACPGTPKPPPAPACPAYVPGEKGAEAATVIVTDAATQEKPVEVEFDFGLGVPENPNQEHEYVHVQVVSDAQPAGLYARFEFATYEDMDLYAYHPNGKLAARAAGYNPAPVAVLNDNANGGHSEQGAEQIDGVRTNSCGGYTIDMVTFQNNSGKKKLKLWLGEGKNDPKPPGEQDAALATFFSLLGL